MVACPVKGQLWEVQWTGSESVIDVTPVSVYCVVKE